MKTMIIASILAVCGGALYMSRSAPKAVRASTSERVHVTYSLQSRLQPSASTSTIQTK